MKTVRQYHFTLVALVVTLLFIVLNLQYRPLLPIDETRYVSVAWEMWVNNSWFVPHINGLPYPDKPPMMFWLINGAWALFGTTEMVTRLVVPIFSLLNLYLIRTLAQKIYPNHSQAANLAPLVLISFSGWLLYSSLTMFDLMLTVFVQAAMLFLWRFADTQKWRWIIICGIAIGMGMLTKGPVTLVFILSFLALSKWWNPKTDTEGLKCIKAGFIAILISIAVIFAWALPAAVMGGDEYAKAILWDQFAGRVVQSFAHNRPPYWYFLLLPALLFPWLFLKGFWQSQPWKEMQAGDKLCLGMSAIVLGVFSCFSGKQIHYLFPVFPFLAIWIAARIRFERFSREPASVVLALLTTIAIISMPFWIGKVFGNAEITQVNLWWSAAPLVLLILTCWPKWSTSGHLTLSMVALPCCFAAVLFSVAPVVNHVYNVTPVSNLISSLQSQGQQVAYVGKYHNTFGYSGKLTEPLATIPGNADAIRAHLRIDSGYTILVQRTKTRDETLFESALYSTPYRSGWLYLVPNPLLSKVLGESQ